MGWAASEYYSLPGGKEKGPPVMGGPLPPAYAWSSILAQWYRGRDLRSVLWYT